MAHYAPEPDPLAKFRGVSWVSQVLREIDTDRQLTEHKAGFLERGATPSFAIKNPETIGKGDQGRERQKELVESFRAQHEGGSNSWKALHLFGGADPVALGSNFRDLDYKAVQGAGETRIASRARVPAAVLGISEGLQGSALNAGNFGQARRQFGDQVGIGYRATLGVISWLRYTLFPDRVFGGLPIPFVGGGDHFNPFSNTVHVFSSDLAILLHEGGHAKDYVRHRARGTTFVLLRLLPGIDLIQEAVASQDAIQFLYCIRDDGAEVHAYSTLIPAYSTYVAGYFTGGLVVTLPIVASGHVVGRSQAWSRRRALEEES